MLIVRLIICVLWAFSIAKYCGKNDKNVVLGLGIFVVMVIIMLTVMPNPIMPGTLSALATYGILYFIPRGSSSQSDEMKPVFAPVAAATSANRTCPGCKSVLTMDATRCVECGRSLAGM